ncbi:glucose-6-phosphate isomerase [Parasutterella muris]|uniref:glucose-6-phosphate isomerase n=1 Tax=Parasutterella muris TaxID=2565572 RepID=UPI00203FD47B|nr:glucose-6-phosphate isomerase [Parasutterella muris]
MQSLTTAPFIRDSFESFQKSACGITLDLGRQRISQKELLGLIDFVKEKRMIESFNEMRQGKIVNPSEGRSALHTSLRDPSPKAPHAKEVHETLERFCKFADNVKSWKWRGSAGDRITDVINIGIGGSDMGPRTVWNALRSAQPEINLHFLASADGVVFDRVTSTLDPYKTLVVISSKSFKTQETQSNAKEIFKWFFKAGLKQDKLKNHIVVVSAKEDAADFYGLPRENYFPIWDWIGGRFSVWGAIGLPVAIALGSEIFKRFLAGAHQMDKHASFTPLQENLPALMAMFAYWNVTKLDVSSFCFLPYDERLRTMVDWLQQLEMESLGKSTKPDGSSVIGKTSLAVWGGHGNESQHSFYQWLREGTANTAIDVCWCKKPGHNHSELNRVLMANAKAQTEALVTRDPSSKYFNVVSTITLDDLTPESLGALMAMYEHKTTMLGTLFGVNAFDQPGVEFGKLLAREILDSKDSNLK